MNYTVEKIGNAKQLQTKSRTASQVLHSITKYSIPCYAKLTYPLIELIKEEAPNQVIWRSKHQTTFEKIKPTLSKTIAPNFTRNFVHIMDASKQCLGAVVLQHDET